jgi:cytochrome c oxidase assembly factor CtaG
MRTSKTVTRWVYGTATVAALGFGGAQAMASPAPVADAAPVCNPQVCNRVCQAIPGSIGGFCGSDGSCNCYIGG